MKKLFFLIVLLLSCPVQAQMLDLLEDDDASETMPGMPVAKPVDVKPAAKPAQPLKPKPIKMNPVQMVETTSAPSKAVSTPVLAPKTSDSKPEIANGGTPNIGGGDKPSIPNLGDQGAVKKYQKRTNSESLFEMRKKSNSRHRRGKSKKVFDIAGIRTGMTPNEVINIATDKGFSLKFSNKQVPEFDTWKYKRKCLNSAALPFHSLKACIDEAAKEEKSEYIQKLTFENKPLKETLVVDFTSNATDNQAFRIHYTAKGDHSLGVTKEGLYLKNKRRHDFYNALKNKYGESDYEESFVWVDSDSGTMLMADISDTFLDVSIELECSKLEADDDNKISEKEAQTATTGVFNF
ncbi:MAG: hypothetical protein MJ250_01605 [Alphaproteobacteria bacterium]|nr:hypothetical protein [Alphaproteobacteria bacterium]